MIIAWEAQSQDPENAKNFEVIAEWWKSLNTKSVLWKQRLIPEEGEVDWSPQRFDDTFVCMVPEVRGISFYWQKEESEEVSNITPAKLEFNPTRQQLYLYPEQQEDLIISVEVPGAARESLLMKNPAWFTETTASGYRLLIQDKANQVEVQVEMDANSLNLLRNTLNTVAPE
jgi:hypothetical protein